MTHHHERIFFKESVCVDGDVFTSCEFHECTILYRGGKIRLEHCRFDNCQWFFERAAARTICTLQAIYHGMKGGAEIVEPILAEIRTPPTEE